METRSIHDNRVVGYEVDGERRRIVLHTEAELGERTDVVFEGVVAYFLENDNFGNILFGIAELPISELVARNRNAFETGAAFAFPGSWNVSLDASVAYMQGEHAKAFEISSSYGLSGWVVAKACVLTSANAA